MSGSAGQSESPAPESTKRAKIWRRTQVGGSLAVAVALLLWLASIWSPAVLLFGTLLSWLAVLELGRMGSLAGRKLTLVLSPAVVALIAAHVVPKDTLDFDSEWHPLLGAAALTALVTGVAHMAFLRETRTLARSMGYALWLVVPLPALAYVHETYGGAGLVSLVILSKIGDNAGYFVGSAIGKTHPFKGISPGKTTAGCVASLVAGIVTGGVLVAVGALPSAGYGIVGGLLAGGVTNIAAQAGDLLESWVKRRAGVKDSGTWFGPSGGVLDLVDSLLLAVPVSLLLWPMIFSG